MKSLIMKKNEYFCNHYYSPQPSATSPSLILSCASKIPALFMYTFEMHPIVGSYPKAGEDDERSNVSKI